MDRLPIVKGEVRIIYEHGEPYGIRDDTGFLFSFNRVHKYEGQEERYRKELERRFALVDFLVASLKAKNSIGGAKERMRSRKP